jgi:hypothetical protein
MAKSLKNLIAPTPLWCAEITNRLKRLEDIVSFLGGASFVFDNNTSSGDPGPGRFRLDNSVKALSVAAFVSNITEGGIDVDDIYDGVDPGDQMIFAQENDPSRNLHVTITAVADNGTWHKFDYNVDASNGAEFQNNRSCSISIIRN